MSYFKKIVASHSSLSIKTKLIILAMLVFLLTFIPVFHYISTVYQNIMLTSDEVRLINLYKPLIDNIQISHKFNDALLSTSNVGSIDGSAYENQINSNIISLQNLANDSDFDKINEDVKKYVSYLQLHKSALFSKNIQLTMEEFVKLSSVTTELVREIASNDAIILDPHKLTSDLLRNVSFNIIDAMNSLSSVALYNFQYSHGSQEALIKVESYGAIYEKNIDLVLLFNARSEGLASGKRSNLASLLDDATIKNYLGQFNIDSSHKLAAKLPSVFSNLTKVYSISIEVLNDELNSRLVSQKINLVVSLVFVFIIYIVLYLSFAMIFKSITTSIRDLSGLADQIASGSLKLNFIDRPRDEFNLLIESLYKMSSKLSDTIKKVQQGISGVARGSTEISQGNLDLSHRTEKQATSLASTAASMEELSVTVKENASQSQKASELAENVCSQADIGSEVVKQAMTAMDNISSSSKRIAEIITVIDSIAFQTNLLALNAAVEAARAGEQGRGFAVVASEVRNLAQRCAKAAKEINNLINTSVNDINEGGIHVNKSGESLQSIVKSINELSSLVKSIDVASKEQAVGIEEINKAVTEMDSITQQNAALVEQTAAASENLNQQAQQLSGHMDYFVLDDANNSGNSESSTFKVSSSLKTEDRSYKKLEELKKKLNKQNANSNIDTKSNKIGQGSVSDDWKEF